MSNQDESNDPPEGRPALTELSLEDVSAYYLELERLLYQVEDATTYYQALGLDYLATMSEVKLAYVRAGALLNPAYYGIRVPEIGEMRPRVEQALEKVAQAFAVLVNFNKRAEYDRALFRRDEADAGEGEAAAEGRPAADRRADQRFQLALPVRVTGYDRRGNKWFELTQSVDVSRGGARLMLAQSVRPGLILYLTMPMPSVLRDYGFFDLSYSVYAVVRRVEAVGGRVSQVGLEFIGEQPPGAYFDRPWDIFQVHQWGGPERRRHPRKKRSEMVGIEYFDKALDYVRREWAFTEDVSRSGMRVCVKAPPAEIGCVRVASAGDRVTGVANVTNRYVGRDGFHRLCLEFVDLEWPIS